MEHWMKSVGSVIVGLVVGLLLGKVLPKDAAHTNVDWEFPGGKLAMNVQKDLTSPEVMFEKLFQTEFSEAGTLALLRKRAVFSVTDLQLVEKLAETCRWESGVTETVEVRHARLSQCVEGNLVLKELRRRALAQNPPFQPVGESVSVGIPERQEDRPRKGFANACRNGPFFGNSVQIVNPRNRRSITVVANQWYRCLDTEVFPDLQLSKEDAIALFDGGTDKKEVVMAVLNPS